MYLISFPSEAMVLTEEDFAIVGRAARDVVEEAKAAGVYVFAGGIDEGVGPLLVTSDGSATEGTTYPDVNVPNGGYTILDLPSREAAVEWAAKIAIACRCAQEIRQFQ